MTIKERRNQQIGIRFTQTERNLIEIFASNRNLTLAEYVRECIFLRIQNSQVDIKNLDIAFFTKQLEKLKTTIKALDMTRKTIKKKLTSFEIMSLLANIKEFKM